MGLGGHHHVPAALLVSLSLVGADGNGGFVDLRDVLSGYEKFHPTGILSPDGPSCSESLDLLRYPVPPCTCLPLLSQQISLLCLVLTPNKIVLICRTASYRE